MSAHTQRIPEAVGVFATAARLHDAIDDLLSRGFDKAELSLLASDAAVSEKLARVYRSTRELMDEPVPPGVAYVSHESVGDAGDALPDGLLHVGAMTRRAPVFTSGGAIGVALLAGALLGGASASIRAVLARWIARRDADRIEDQLARGGLMLWVHAASPEREARAVSILRSGCGDDVGVHALPARHCAVEHHYSISSAAAAECFFHHRAEIIRAADGHCFAFGRLFTTLREARAFVDAMTVSA